VQRSEVQPNRITEWKREIADAPSHPALRNKAADELNPRCLELANKLLQNTFFVEIPATSRALSQWANPMPSIPSQK
jgi:hypothetical protein